MINAYNYSISRASMTNANTIENIEDTRDKNIDNPAT